MTKNTSWLLVAAALVACGSSTANSPEPPSNPEPAAEPAAYDETLMRACSVPADCTLVPSTCGGWAAVNKAHLDVSREHHAMLMASASCLAIEPGGATAPGPTGANCTNDVCETYELDHPEWRACDTAANCVALHDVCSGVDAVNLASEAAKRAAVAEMAMRVRCVSVTEGPLPTPVCRGSFCVPY